MRSALVCIACGEDPYIEDWINYHHKIGYDDIFVFQNNWRYRSPDKNSFFIPLDGKVRQLDAYNFFLTIYRKDYDYVSFIDVDEFLVLKKHQNVKELFEDYKDVPCLALNWKLFGSNGLKTMDSRPVWRRFTKSQKGVNRHIKTSVNLEFCRTNNVIPKFINPHFTSVIGYSPEKKEVKGPWNDSGSDETAYIAHYIVKSEEECKERRSRERADTASPREEGWQQFFKEHDKNEIENNDVKEMYEKTV